MQLQRLSLAALLILPVTDTLSAAPLSSSCPDEQKIHKKFPSGATWDFCWSIRTQEGLSLSQIYYKAPDQEKRRVLGEAALAEILTVPDTNNTRPTFTLTQQGLGGSNILELQRSDCPDGNLRSINGKNVLCRSTHAYGHQYRSNLTRRGYYFELFSVSRADVRSYTNRWRFYENGTIEPALGVSGSFPPNHILSNTSFTEHAIWRLDFDIGENAADDIVEEISSIPDQTRLKKTKKISVFGQESGRAFDPETKRFWRIRDSVLRNNQGRFISYELAPLLHAYSRSNVRQQEWLDNDIYITHYRACERYAAKNHLIYPGCGFNVMNYIDNAEPVNPADIVIWYKQSQRHLQRDENIGRAGTVWNTFQLVPRDWHEQNPF